MFFESTASRRFEQMRTYVKEEGHSAPVWQDRCKNRCGSYGACVAAERFYSCAREVDGGLVRLK